MKALVWLLRAVMFIMLFGLAIKNSGLVELRFFLNQGWQAPLSLVLLAVFTAGVVIGLAAAVGAWTRQRRELARVARKAGRRRQGPAHEWPPPSLICARCPHGGYMPPWGGPAAMMEIELWWLLALPLFFGLGWVAARIDIRHVIRESQALPRSYFKGLNFLLNEQPDKAIDAFIEAARVDPETIELHFALGSLFRRRGETDRAIRVHQNLVERDGTLTS